jgi:hypothetical protein
MYTSTMTSVSAARIQEWRDQAAIDRLVIQARRARREAAAAQAGLWRRPWSKWWAGRTAVRLVPADATPDQWASALSMAGAAERANADDRQPVGGRVS